MYKKAIFDLVEFDVEDVITTSKEVVPPADPKPIDEPSFFPDEN